MAGNKETGHMPAERQKMEKAKMEKTELLEQCSAKDGKSEYIYIYILRALATVAVITYHTGSGGSHPSDAAVRGIVSLFNNWCVPMFVMISGALFLGREITLNLKHHGKKIAKLLLLIAFWGMVYNVLPQIYISKQVNLDIFLSALKMTIMADTTYCYHFWYLYMVIGLYILLPILKAFLNHSTRKEHLTLTALFFMFSVLIPSIQRAAGYESKDIWFNGFTYFNGYAVYLLLGFLLHRYQKEKWLKHIMFASAIITMSMVAFCVILLLQGNAKYEDMYGYLSLTTCGATMCLFWFFLQKNMCFAKGTAYHVAVFISQYSLSIYILHPMLLQMFRKLLGLGSEFAPLYISLPVLTVLALCVSICAAWILKKIPVIREII